MYYLQAETVGATVQLLCQFWTGQRLILQCMFTMNIWAAVYALSNTLQVSLKVCSISCKDAFTGPFQAMIVIAKMLQVHFVSLGEACSMGPQILDSP